MPTPAEELRERIEKHRTRGTSAPPEPKAPPKVAIKPKKAAKVEGQESYYKWVAKKVKDFGWDITTDTLWPDFQIRTEYPEVDKKWQRFIPSNTKVQDILPDPKVMYHLARAYASGDTVLFTGHAGTGKTNGEAMLLANMLGLPYYVYRFNGSLEAADILGEVRLTSNGKGTVTEFKPSELMQYCREVPFGFVVQDELFKADPGVLMAFQGMIEPTRNGVAKRTVYIHGADDPVVEIQPELRIIATDNTKGLGDGLGQYTAASVADVSLLNRFDTKIEASYKSEAIQRKLAKRWADGQIEDDLLHLIVRFAKKMEEGFVTGKVPLPWSLRNLYDVIQKTINYEDVGAAVYLNYAQGMSDPAHIEYVAQYFRTVFDKELRA